MYASAFVLGFHGCDEEVGEAVLAGREGLKPSTNSYDWLGHGIYFWENSPKRALEWARYVNGHPGLFRSKINRPFVVGAVIDLGRCLDLMEAESLEFVKAAYSELALGYAALELPLPRNESSNSRDEDLVKRKLDCAVINYVHALRADADGPQPPYDAVRGAFSEGQPLYDGARIMAQTHIQFCVRSAKSIRGYFRPIKL